MTEKCNNCFYRRKLCSRDDLYSCDYLLITGQMRGCKGDENCTRFKEGKGRYRQRSPRVGAKR